MIPIYLKYNSCYCFSSRRIVSYWCYHHHHHQQQQRLFSIIGNETSMKGTSLIPIKRIQTWLLQLPMNVKVRHVINSFGVRFFLVTSSITTMLYISIRQWRQQQIQSIESLQLSLQQQQQQQQHATCIIDTIPLFCENMADNSMNKQRQYKSNCNSTINVSDLIITIHRAGLMGSFVPQQSVSSSDLSPVVEKPPLEQKQQQEHHKRIQQQQQQRPKQRRVQSVQDELHLIRDWHQRNGFYGGIVVRDITTDNSPSKTDHLVKHDELKNNNNDNYIEKYLAEIRECIDSIYDLYIPVQWKEYVDSWNIYIQQQRIARRECYYIYYEIHPITGQQTQQIYIRGTTLLLDIITCIQTYMIYDHDIQCSVHYGFNQHANRILYDILPLLSNDPNTHIELYGHSLGGAVATLLAMKLQSKQYNVTKLITIAEPAWLYQRPTLTRSQRQQQKQHVQSLLPKDHLRIEHDCDIVPYLPPFGSHIGNKIWMVFQKETTFDNNCNNTNNKNNELETTATSLSSSITITTKKSPTATTKVYFIDHVNDDSKQNKLWWTESTFVNIISVLPEIIPLYHTTHRIPNYIESLQRVIQNNNQQ